MQPCCNKNFIIVKLREDNCSIKIEILFIQCKKIDSGANLEKVLFIRNKYTFIFMKIHNLSQNYLPTKILHVTSLKNNFFPFFLPNYALLNNVLTRLDYSFFHPKQRW